MRRRMAKQGAVIWGCGGGSVGVVVHGCAGGGKRWYNDDTKAKEKAKKKKHKKPNLQR